MATPLLSLARSTKGFMPDEEGLALYGAGWRAARRGLGPLVEIGSYCGKSTVYLGAAARAAGNVLVSVDHHRGSEECQPGWEHHDASVVDPETGRIDTLSWWRRAVEQGELEGSVVGVVGDSALVARLWATPVSLVFID
ncbi:MAG: class I SAM-dependent methyltransferase, partial [Acidimicrobiales bacterium]|nr:class I SAM-dependent methyltransferase [Acidimicrobiales bacterium]